MSGPAWRTMRGMSPRPTASSTRRGWRFAPLALACLCAGTSCAGSSAGSSRGGDDASVVAVEALPERERAVLEAYGAGGAAWEQMRAEVRADPALARFTIENLVIEMVRAHDALVGAEPARARAALDRSRAELVRLAPQSVPALTELFALGDEIVSNQVGQVLTLIDRPSDGVAAGVAALLAVPEPRTRQRAARLLGGLGSAGVAEERVLAALAQAAGGDPAWAVRAEAARALGLRAGRGRVTRGARGTLERVLADPDPAVATCAAEGLAALEDPMAVPALIGALERAVGEGDLRLLRAAQGALAAVSGDRLQRDLEGWRQWWRDHGGQIRARAGAPAR